MLDERTIVVHPDGRTQSVKEYVHELVIGAQVRLYEGKELKGKKKTRTGDILKTKQKLSNQSTRLEAVRFQETCIDDDEGVDNAVRFSGQDPGTGKDDPMLSCHVTTDGACAADHGEEESDTHAGWTFLSRLMAVRTALMKATNRRPSQSSEGNEEKRSIVDFFRKRKSSDNTFTTEEKESEEATCSKPRHVTPSPKKQKTRLMSDDSGIAVDIPRRDSEIRNQRLARFRNSIRNFISCTMTGDSTPKVESAEPSEV
ncbi:uncharacterized protein [Argopecten irradians]|uniref:uncharacterized protein n=1 Tax=Argopecten irradians TaxID=31199 RepID=UPI0037235F68